MTENKISLDLRERIESAWSIWKPLKGDSSEQLFNMRVDSVTKSIVALEQAINKLENGK